MLVKERNAKKKQTEKRMAEPGIVHPELKIVQKENLSAPKFKSLPKDNLLGRISSAIRD